MHMQTQDHLEIETPNTILRNPRPLALNLKVPQLQEHHYLITSGCAQQMLWPYTHFLGEKPSRELIYSSCKGLKGLLCLPPLSPVQGAPTSRNASKHRNWGADCPVAANFHEFVIQEKCCMSGPGSSRHVAVFVLSSTRCIVIMASG